MTSDDQLEIPIGCASILFMFDQQTAENYCFTAPTPPTGDVLSCPFWTTNYVVMADNHSKTGALGTFTLNATACSHPDESYSDGPEVTNTGIGQTGH
jgi:hypothetical protein